MQVKLNTAERPTSQALVSCDDCPIRYRAVCANCEAGDLERLEAAGHTRQPRGEH